MKKCCHPDCPWGTPGRDGMWMWLKGKTDYPCDHMSTTKKTIFMKDWNGWDVAINRESGHSSHMPPHMRTKTPEMIAEDRRQFKCRQFEERMQKHRELQEKTDREDERLVRNHKEQERQRNQRNYEERMQKHRELQENTVRKDERLVIIKEDNRASQISKDWLS